MKNTILQVLVLLLVGQHIHAQDSLMTSALRMQNLPTNKVAIGAYAQIDYNQPIAKESKRNGNLDVHRMVMTLGYSFSKDTRFFSEIELEHVNEITVEQAYLGHRFNNYFNLKAGLMLVPMGIINEYHEPPTYNGVERPNTDKYIIPTTWREIGIGFTGRIDEVSLKYQVYLMNGFLGYSEDSGLFRGSDGLRKGRQKGAKSVVSSPNLSTKIDFYGVKGLKLGLATYLGRSQSTLFDYADERLLASADSSTVNIFMIGADARYRSGALQLRSQFVVSDIGNTSAYNTFTGKDLGKKMIGYYFEAGYDVLHSYSTRKQLTPFLRYEQYDTHHQVAAPLDTNQSYKVTEWITGIGWKITSGTVLKGDLQLSKSGSSDKYTKQLNFGVGLMF